ncbi:hypothetical protein AB0I91_27445 [Actinosynnema sp. NPDC049800]
MIRIDAHHRSRHLPARPQGGGGRDFGPAYPRPRVDVVPEAFGPDRLMIGSDRPVRVPAGRDRRVGGTAARGNRLGDS